jgi:hypothetical protein
MVMDRSILQGVRARPARGLWSLQTRGIMGPGVRGYSRDELSPPVHCPNGHHQPDKGFQNANFALREPDRRSACRRALRSRSNLLADPSHRSYLSVTCLPSSRRHGTSLLYLSLTGVPCGPYLGRLAGFPRANRASGNRGRTAPTPNLLLSPRIVAIQGQGSQTRYAATANSRRGALGLGSIFPRRQDIFPGSLPCATPGLPFK